MLADCLQSSDCVMVHQHSGQECLREPLLSTLPTRCQQLKTGLGDCRRGWVDMRKRFRGNMPAAMSKELEGQGQTSVRRQLYGGTPSAEVVRATDGKENQLPEERGR